MALSPGLPAGVYAQASGEEDGLAITAVTAKAALAYRAEAAAFYARRHARPLWLSSWGKSYMAAYAIMLLHYDRLGLAKENYDFTTVCDLLSRELRMSPSDSEAIELRLTGSLFRFYHHLYTGIEQPRLDYHGWPQVSFTASFLARLDFAEPADLLSLAKALEPDFPVYRQIVRKMEAFQKTAAASGFRDVVVRLRKGRVDSNLLYRRLLQLDFLGARDSVAGLDWDSTIRSVQGAFECMVDGKAGRQTLAAVNIPLNKRIAQLEQALNDYRWLHAQQRGAKVIVVNIPAAELKIYESDSVPLKMRTVVGKPRTRTPGLASYVEAVELFPYWQVPKSIVVKEFLPKIRQDDGYLGRNHYEVLDKHGSKISPASVNWALLSAGYFPYQVRQLPGCDNALGLIKFDIPSPFNVYMHDTPERQLFERDIRFYSHGCIRLQKPVDLARLIIPGNTIAVDTLTDSSCLYAGKPVRIAAEVKFPVLVWYNLVDLNEQGHLCFYQDRYRFNENRRPGWEPGP